jgi:antitoxin MazE
MSKTITLKVQQLNGQFVVCIPNDIVTQNHIAAGQLVALKILRTAEEIAIAEAEVPTLEQMLENYDPDKFGGEVMAYSLEGREVIK